MSEPTGGGNQKPDPNASPESGKGQDESQEQVFSDPTAPIWADPTEPVPAAPVPAAPDSPSPAPAKPSASTQDDPPLPPAPPAAPGATYPTYGRQPPAAPQSTPPPAPPMSNPYAQQPPSDPYAQQLPSDPYGQQQPPASPWGPSQPDPYGQPAGQYGQPQYGGQYPAYGQSPYATGRTAPSNTSAIILTIVSGLSMLSSAFVVGIPSLVFGIMALTTNSTDPTGSRRKSKIGWIIYAVNVGVVALLVVIAVIGLFAFSSSTTTFDNGF